MGWAGRHFLAAVSYDGYIWIFGGRGESEDYNDVWKSPDGVNWTLVTSSAPWSKRAGLAACVHDGKMYISGGDTGRGTSYHGNPEVWYSTDGKNWTHVGDTGKYLFLHSLVSYDGCLWQLGGRNCWPTCADTSDVRKSTDGGANWTKVGDLPNNEYGHNTRSEFGCVSFGGYIYILGGRDVRAGASGWDYSLDDIWRTSDGVNWTKVLDHAPWGRRYSFGCVVHNNEVYVIGGNTESSTGQVDVWKSSNMVDWQLVCEKQIYSDRRHRDFGCVSHNDYIYIVGGDNEYYGAYTDHVYESSGMHDPILGIVDQVESGKARVILEGRCRAFSGLTPGQRYWFFQDSLNTTGAGKRLGIAVDDKTLVLQIDRTPWS